MQLGCVDQGLGLALGSFHKYCFCGSRFLDMTIRQEDKPFESIYMSYIEGHEGSLNVLRYWDGPFFVRYFELEE